MSHITLVIGGARSGKSRHAQDLAERRSGGGDVLYIATAQAGDDEMRERIARHKEDRPDHWRTIEEPLEVSRVLNETAAAVVLLDCLTFFVVNHMLKSGDAATCETETWDGPGAETAVISLMEAAAAHKGDIIIVTNEVGFGLVPETPLGRAFRDTAGRANQTAAAQADQVILMVAGIPLQVKQ